MTSENSIVLPTQTAQLFEKRIVAELTEDQMMAVDGGTSVATNFGTTSLVIIALRLV
jgi:hypothetical protein